MSAPTWRSDAATPAQSVRSTTGRDLWQQAIQIRQEWLGHALSTEPADRATAERCVTAIYARMSRPRPRFEWVDSPDRALPLIDGWPTLERLYEWIRDPRPRGTPPLASDLAMVASQLRAALSAGVTHTDPELSPTRSGKTKEPWPELPPPHALDRPGLRPPRPAGHAWWTSHTSGRGLFTSASTSLCAERAAPLRARLIAKCDRIAGAVQG
ncbi:hypothetical protein [Micromonospora sp. URMC 103]|uniref:hypothetical protein n=1 Tax=Micromonospora sp. URMC 103 TaxID=3423406 RepID=UPI003F1BFD7D